MLEWQASVIPRIIHQIYMQGWDALPADVKENILALRERNPNWQYRFYDETLGRSFISRRLPEYLAVYDKIDPAYFAARSDFLRYCVCYVDGGFYLDVKSIAKKPLDEVLNRDDELVLSQWPLLDGKPSQHPELGHISGCEYVIFFIASSRTNPLLGAVLSRVAKNINDYRLRDGVGRLGVLRTTGPIAFSLAVEAERFQYPHRIAHMDNDLHLEPSIYGDHFSHQSRFGQHYSQLSMPIVRLDPVRSALAFLLFVIVGPVLAIFRNKLARISAKVWN